MRMLPETMSPLEAGWFFTGIFGMLFTVIAIVFAVRSLLTVFADIRNKTASFTGPRFYWSAWFFVAMLFFFGEWLGFAVSGFIVSSLPDVRPTREISVLEALLEVAIVGGAVCSATGQACIVAGWMFTRRAVAFIPNHPHPQEDHIL